MDYKKISNELLFTYHKNIDFVYKVLGEFLYNTQNFNRKYSKSYKTSEGKVFVSWDKSNDWSLKLNESVSRSDIKLSIKESNEYQPVDAYPGDYVDFGPYGKLYICKDLGDRYWVTDEESDAGNPNAQGWYIDKDLARDIIYSADDFEDEDFNIDESLGDDLIDSQYQDDTSDGHWSWDYDDDELANIYGGDTKYDKNPDGIDIDEYDLMEIDNYDSQFEECLSESDKTHTFVTPEGKELKSSHFVKLFKDAVKTGAWHKKFGKQGELTRVEIENANKRENRLRMQLAELFGYSQEEIDAIEEEALSEPITADYLEESQNTDLHEGNSIAEDTSDRTSTDFSWSKGWCDCGAKDVFPHMLFATDAGTVFREGPYGYRLRGEVFAENPNIFHAYVMKYTDNSDYASHGQGGKTVVGKENLDSLEAAKAFIEDWFTNSFDSYVKTKNESLTETTENDGWVKRWNFLDNYYKGDLVISKISSPVDAWHVEKVAPNGHTIKHLGNYKSLEVAMDAAEKYLIKNESKSIVYTGKKESLAEDLNRYEFLVKRYGREEDRETITAISLEDAEDQLNSDGHVEYWDYLPDFNYDIDESVDESKSIKEGTFHWSDNKAAYEAIKVKNALKKAFNTHVFQDDSQNLYIPFNFWGRKDAEKAGVTIDTVGKFLNSIGYKYTGKSEDDEDVYNYLKDDVKIELYEVNSNRYAIHLDFDSEVDDKLDIDTTSFSSYVNTDDADAVQDLLLDIVEGRVKTLGDIVISEEDIKNIKRLCGRTLDMYTYDFAGYSDDIVDKIDDYFAMKQYQELHNKHVAESKSIKEGIEIDTIADYITDHYDFDDIDDKYNCINSIKDSFKNEKTISKEELEQFIGSHNGKDKVTEGIDGWDNRTGVIKRIDKYLYDNPEAIPPKGYIQPGSRAYDDAVSRYGDYVTTPFGNISTDDLMQYARDNKLLDESKYTSSLIGPDSLLMNAEEAYFDGNLGDFVTDSLNDGSATEEELLAVTEKSSFIEYDDMLNAIDYAKSLSSF